MLKNAYFFKRKTKICLGVGVSAPKVLLPLIPVLLLLPAITTLSSLFLALKCVLLLSKENKITIRTLINVLLLFLPHFCAYFTLQILF